MSFSFTQLLKVYSLISVTLGENVIDARFAQPSKAYCPMIVKLRCNVTLVRSVFWKAYSPMLAKEAGIVNCAREVQFLKALLPMVEILSKRLMLFNAVQLLKALSGIVVPTLPLKLILVKAVQLVHLKSSMVTPAGMVRAVSFVQPSRLPISTTPSGKVRAAISLIQSPRGRPLVGYVTPAAR